MDSPTDESFRRVERTLDQLMEAAASQFDEHGTAATDESDRTYHYKNNLLTWSHRFESRKPHRGPEIALVTIRIKFTEPMTSDALQEVDIWSRLEVFQIGQLSRWEHIEQQSIAIADLIGQGLAELVCTAVSNGHAEICSNRDTVSGNEYTDRDRFESSK